MGIDVSRLNNPKVLIIVTKGEYSLKLSQEILTVEAAAKDPQTAKDLFDYALDKSGLIPKS